MVLLPALDLNVGNGFTLSTSESPNMNSLIGRLSSSFKAVARQEENVCPCEEYSSEVKHRFNLSVWQTEVQKGLEAIPKKDATSRS